MAVHPLIERAHHVADGLGALAKNHIARLGACGQGRRGRTEAGNIAHQPRRQHHRSKGRAPVQRHQSLIFQPSFCLTRSMYSVSVLPFLNVTCTCTRMRLSPCSVCSSSLMLPRPPLASIFSLDTASATCSLPLTSIISLAETCSSASHVMALSTSPWSTAA